MAPLANGFTMGCGHERGCRLVINHPPQPGAPKVAMVSPDRIVTPGRVQTYMMRCQPWLDLNMP